MHSLQKALQTAHAQAPFLLALHWARAEWNRKFLAYVHIPSAHIRTVVHANGWWYRVLRNPSCAASGSVLYVIFTMTSSLESSRPGARGTPSEQPAADVFPRAWIYHSPSLAQSPNAHPRELGSPSPTTCTGSTSNRTPCHRARFWTLRTITASWSISWTPTKLGVLWARS